MVRNYEKAPLPESQGKMDLILRNYFGKGYEVHGIVRRALTADDRLNHLYKDPLVDDTNLYLHYGDLADAVQLVKLCMICNPTRFII